MIDNNGPGAVTLAADDAARARAAVKAVLRVGSTDEDVLVVAFAETALGLAERFLGRVLIARAMTETLVASSAWIRLGAAPVTSIGGVAPVAGAPLAIDAYAVDIDAQGQGWMRLARNAPLKVTVDFVAGVAPGWDAIPQPVRQGAVLLAAHLFTQRDAADPPPAAVTALWRPFRALRLGTAWGDRPC